MLRVTPLAVLLRPTYPGRMEIALPFLFLAGLITAGVVWRRRADRNAREAARDDTQRAGADQTQTPEAAARLAEGKAAWMRPTGF
jgi:hypothetical protein